MIPVPAESGHGSMHGYEWKMEEKTTLLDVDNLSEP
jgi:hypothetical protein